MQNPPIQYREYKPGPALQPFIECYWAGTPGPAGNGPEEFHRVVPDGCIDILVEFDLSPGETGGRVVPAFADRTSVVGTMSRPLIVTPGPAACFLGVRFKPGKAMGFLGASAGELTDQSIPLTQFWGRESGCLEAQLTERHDIGTKLALLETTLLGKLERKKDEDPYVEALVGMILGRRGAVSIGALSQFAGISRQHVARKFDRHVGISPKLFCRIMRFQELMRTIRLGSDTDWATTALELGYYDQAHMISEFKEFSGLTPTLFAVVG